MGACASAPAPPPLLRCESCDLESAAPWTALDAEARDGWVHDAAGGCSCRPCEMKAQMERLKHARDARKYKRYKLDVYPRNSFRTRLRTLVDGHAWDEKNPSFGKHHRPPAWLAALDREAREREAAAVAAAEAAAAEAAVCGHEERASTSESDGGSSGSVESAEEARGGREGATPRALERAATPLPRAVAAV
jgi:hypothetical protein